MAPKNVDEKFALAKQKIAFQQRFLTPKMFSLKFVKREGVGTACTDGVHVWWDPNYVDQLPNTSQVMFLIAHEVMHPARKHHLRALNFKNLNKQVANIAMDAVINLMLVEEMKLEKPDGCVWMPKYRGWAWEDVYKDLMKNAIEIEGQMWDEVLPYPGREGESDKKGKGKGKGDPVPGEGGQADSVEARAEDKRIDGQLKEMERIGKKAGNLPGGMSDLVKEMTETKVPWEQVLARFVDENSDKDYDWMAPDENYINGDIYIPTLHDPKIGKIGIIFDTSGSVGREDFKKFVGGLFGILSAYDTEVFCIDVDYDVSNPRTISSAEVHNLKVEFMGRGGTSFVPGFNYMVKEDIQPKVVIYFTDGECWEYPDPHPDYPVLWAVLKRGHDFSPPFGEVLVID
jgi:predicted metal-dependent peptidase